MIRRIPVRLIQDPRYGAVQLLPFQLQLLQTPHFQRLYNLKQLGCTYHVYPGAVHTRAEHSLGVAWLSRVLIRCIRTNQPDVEITERDERLIVLAAQAHDLGHGIASHAYEGWLHSLDDPNYRSWAHEEQSVRILRDAVDKGLIPCLADDHDGVLRIEAFILGKHPRHVRSNILPKEKRWMLDIVSNSRNGMDVDMLDYLARDAHHTLGSVDNGLLNVQRILENSRVSSDKQRLCFHRKTFDTLCEVFHRRWLMFRSIYLHNTTVGIELMLRDVLTSLLCSKKFTLLRIGVVGNKIDDYLLLDDSLTASALATERMLTEEERRDDVQLVKACDLLRSIGRREIYRCVSRKTVPTLFWKNRKQLDNDVTDCKNWLPSAFQDESDTFIVHSCCFHYGGGENNPLNHIYFYDWNSPDECEPMQAREYTRMLPRHWSEIVLRVYSKKLRTSEEIKMIDDAFVTFVKNLANKVDGSSEQTEENEAKKQRRE